MARVSLAEVGFPGSNPAAGIAAAAEKRKSKPKPKLVIHDPASPATPAAGSAQPTASAAAPPKHEVLCPITGELIDADNIDGLIDCYERVKTANAALYPVELEIRQLLAAQTEGQAKTRRVRGLKRIAKIEMPDDSWDQPALRNIWAEFEAFRDEFLKIGTIDVKKREYAKLVNATGPKEFERFRDLLTSANKGMTGTPRVTVEK